MTVKVICWNIAGKRRPWHCLSEMDADIALLQEAGKPPQDLPKSVDVDTAPWCTAGWPGWPRRTAIVRLSDRVTVSWIRARKLGHAELGELAVSRPGTLTAALVEAPDIEPLVVISMYAMWENPHSLAGGSWIVPDASAHRLVSDLSAFIGRQDGHRILAAGDLNILYGYGEFGSEYWASRYGTVFTRMEMLGLPFVGPQTPNGRQAEPWPDELPKNSKNVLTFHSGSEPGAATRQLDFVFASKGMVDSVRVRALNDPVQWGPSDHCRLEIRVT